MINKLAEAYGLPEVDIEELMLQPECLSAIDRFLSADGQNRILVSLETTTAGRMLVVHDKFVKMESNSSVYFMKNKKGKDNNDRYAVDPSKITDGALTFGVVKSPLESLEVVLRCVYKPMIQQMGTETWGQASQEQQSEFMIGLDSFSKGLQESIRSLTGGLELRKPEERIENMSTTAQNDPAVVINCLNLLQEWCYSIEKYLEDSERRWDTPDSGPDTELDHWRTRMQR
jgi:hypothetical protein